MTAVPTYLYCFYLFKSGRIKFERKIKGLMMTDEKLAISAKIINLAIWVYE